MNISFASISKAGPRSINEDFLACWKAEAGETIACIADGLGGMGGGDLASRIGVEEFRNNMRGEKVNFQSMSAAALAAHRAIIQEQNRGIANRMATTLTALAMSPSGIVGVHCGDSRAVIARGKGIKRLTKDHSEGQRLFEAGKISKEELSVYPRKHILESALGVREDPIIDQVKFDLLLGDRIILTTDGVHNVVLLREMQRLCANSSSPEALTERVDDLIRERGPTDNYSLMAIFVD